MYSAIKLNGKKLYQYARQGKEVKVEPREIEIYNIELEQYDSKTNEIKFIVECSKGTYIRSLCNDIAERLGTIGCLKDLERVKVGTFSKEQSITIEELKNNIEFIKKHLISFEDLLEKNETIKLDNKQLNLFLNGVKLNKNLPDGVYKVTNEENIFIGTGEIKNKTLKRDIIL